jgi:hypothetical protein
VAQLDMDNAWFAQYGASGNGDQTYGIVHEGLAEGETLTGFGTHRYVGAYRKAAIPIGETYTYTRKLVILDNKGAANPWDPMQDFVGRKYDITVGLDKNTYRSGEEIVITATVTNLTDTPIDKASLGASSSGNLTAVGGSTADVFDIAPGETKEASVSYVAVEAGRIVLKAEVCINDVVSSAFEKNVSILGAGWYAGDQHSHTTYSDGSGSIRNNADIAYSKGLSWNYSTDHNTMAQRFDSDTVTAQFATNGGDYINIAGNEVTSGIGHALAYDIPYSASSQYNATLNRVGSAGRTWQTVIDEIHRDGGLLFVAHPNYPGLMYPDMYNVRDLDGVEVWNGFYHALDIVNRCAFKYWDELNVRGDHIYGLASSDGHNPGKVGDPHIVGYLEDITAENVNKLYRTGNLYGTNGPGLRFDINGTGIGDTLKINGNSELAQISIKAYDENYPLTKVTLYKLKVTGNISDQAQAVVLSGGIDSNTFTDTKVVVKEWNLAGQNLYELSEVLELVVSDKDFYRIEVQSTRGTSGDGGAGMGNGTGFAFSNPIWVEGEAKDPLSANDMSEIGQVRFDVNGTHVPLVIDGNVSDAKYGAPIATLNLGDPGSYFIGESYLTAQDLGKVLPKDWNLYATYDDEYLYVASTVYDESHNTPKDGTAIWEGDYLGFDIGANASGSFADMRDRSRFAIGMSNNGNTCMYLANRQSNMSAYPEGYIFDASEGMVHRDENTKITTYEMRIPWNAITPDGKPVTEAYVMFYLGLGHEGYESTQGYGGYIGTYRYAVEVPMEIQAEVGGTVVYHIADFIGYVDSYTVQFVDWDGTVLKEQIVAEGKDATAPADPVRDGYIFSGWDKNFTCITDDITITAMWEPASEVQITSIKIDGTSMVSASRNSTLAFCVTLNEGASDEGVVWSVSDPSIATANADGTVTIHNKAGMVMLTATDPESGLFHMIVLRVS